MSHPASSALTSLVGRTVHRVVRYEDGPIGVLLVEPPLGSEPDRGSPVAGGSGYSYLHVVAGAWRLLDGDSLLDGSYHEAAPDDLGYADRLIDRALDGVQVEATGDAVISLSGLRLVVWCAAAREPSFLWYRPGAESVVVKPDGTWTHAVLHPDDPLRQLGDLAVELADHDG